VGFARQGGLVGLQLGSLQQPQVGRHDVARFQQHDVARHELHRGQRHGLAAAHDLRLGCRHFPKGCYGALGAKFLYRTDDGI